MNSTASAWYSTASAHNSTASGAASIAAANYSEARTYSETQFGTYVDTVSLGLLSDTSATAFSAPDALFVIGNGTADDARSNAFLIRKDCSASFTDSVYVAGNTMIAGALDINNFDVDASGNLDLDANLDMDGTTADFQASGGISLDAGAASNFTTSAGLTLEGGAGVTVTSTGGSMTLNGTGQTVYLDAATLDVDAATITVDATTTTFTGDVKGPRSTGDDEFVTYAQLDSMANKAPFNETYKAYKYPGGTAQNFPTGVKTRMVLEDDGALDFYYAELSGPVTNPDDPTEPPYSIQGPTADYHMNLADKGIYQYFLSIEFENVGAVDAFVVVEVVNRDITPDAFFGSERIVSSESEFLYGSGFTYGLPVHVNTGMTFETNNDDEDIYVDITVYGSGASVDLKGMSFSLSRVGEE